MIHFRRCPKCGGDLIRDDFAFGAWKAAILKCVTCGWDYFLDKYEPEHSPRPLEQLSDYQMPARAFVKLLNRRQKSA